MISNLLSWVLMELDAFSGIAGCSLWTILCFLMPCSSFWAAYAPLTFRLSPAQSQSLASGCKDSWKCTLHHASSSFQACSSHFRTGPFRALVSWTSNDSHNDYPPPNHHQCSNWANTCLKPNSQWEDSKVNSAFVFITFPGHHFAQSTANTDDWIHDNFKEGFFWFKRVLLRGWMFVSLLWFCVRAGPVCSHDFFCAMSESFGGSRRTMGKSAGWRSEIMPFELGVCRFGI